MKTFRLALVVIAVGLLCVGNAGCKDESGVVAVQFVGELPSDIRYEDMIRPAMDGDGSAMFNLGLMYASGKGVPQDNEKAVRWWVKAVDNERRQKAVDNEGVPELFEEEESTPSSPPSLFIDTTEDLGLTNWSNAAPSQQYDARYNLGLMYFRGEGVFQDKEKAVELWASAAVGGNAPAMYRLGSMYYEGRCVLKYDVEAYAWLNIAVANGQKRAAKLREQIRKEITPEQVAEGQKRSRKLMREIEVINWLIEQAKMNNDYFFGDKKEQQINKRINNLITNP